MDKGGGGEGAKSPSLCKIFHTYSKVLKLGTVIPCLKRKQKIYESCDPPLQLSWYQHLFIGNQQILLFQKIQIQIVFWYIISSSFNIFWVLKEFFNRNGYNFQQWSAKLAAPGLLKVKKFRSKSYDVLIPDYDVISKISSRESNYIVVVVMWPKFGSSSISMKEFIITSNL